MHTWIQRQHTRTSSFLLGLVLAVSVVWIGALHYAPAAHAHVHDDAHEQDHHCVVEIFADGLVSDAEELHVIDAAEIIAAETSVRAEVRVEETAHLRPPGRAPPLG